MRINILGLGEVTFNPVKNSEELYKKSVLLLCELPGSEFFLKHTLANLHEASFFETTNSLGSSIAEHSLLAVKKFTCKDWCFAIHKIEKNEKEVSYWLYLVPASPRFALLRNPAKLIRKAHYVNSRTSKAHIKRVAGHEKFQLLERHFILDPLCELPTEFTKLISEITS